MSRGEKPQVTGADYNKFASIMDGNIVKVATGISGLMVSDTEVVASAKLAVGAIEGARQENLALDHEGRMLGVVVLPPVSARLCQDDRTMVPAVAASPGQEGQGMAVLKCMTRRATMCST